jgi:hypothetical protein
VQEHVESVRQRVLRDRNVQRKLPQVGIWDP